MSNFAMGLFLIIFAAFGLPVTILSVLNRRETTVSGWFTVLCASNICWTVLYALEYLLPENPALFMHSLKFVLISASALSTYLVVLGTLRQKRLDRRLMTCLLAFPFCTLLVAFSDNLLGTGLISASIRYDLVGGVRVAVANEGVWFWIHCVFCYILLALAGVTMIRHLVKVPKHYRTTVMVLLIGVSLSAVMTVLAILRVLPYSFDASSLASVLAQTFYYFAVFHPQSVDFLMSSREVVFEKANYPMLVLDNNRSIVDFNGYAAGIARSVGIGLLRGSDYDSYLESWMKASAAHISEDDPSIFTIHEAEGDVHYQVSSNPIYSGSHKQRGTHVEIKNITPTMALVHRLQAAAYFDDLTGLRNRNYFARVSQDYDREAYFPLGVLVGDVNNLKIVNDTLGHTHGDVMLQKVAGILNACKPPDTVVFRVGGDEFIALTPAATARVMEQYIADIRARCEQASEAEGHPLTVALGYKLKANASESIQEVVHQADLEMYRDKQDRRKNNV